MGIELANQFFGGSDQVEEAQAFFRLAVPDWRLNDGADVSFAFEAPLGAMFPIELLPIVDYSSDVQVTDTASLAAAARRFIGFGSMVSRLVPRLHSPPPRDAASDHVRRRMFHDVSLGGAVLEAEAFADLPGLILDGPWPDELAAEQDVAGIIARTTLDVASNFDGHICRDDVVQFVHFACHRDTTATKARNYKISVQGSRGGPREISLGLLRTRMTQHFQKMPQDRRRLPRAVVVLNSCGAAQLDPHTAVSFPELFLSEQLGGFIGPETQMPDDTAADFSRQFLHGFDEANVGR